MRRLFLPPEGRAWWPEPLMLVVMAAFLAIRRNGSELAASALLVAAVFVALYNRFGWPSESG